MSQLRTAFRKQMEVIEERVVNLFPLVSKDSALATEALLGGDAGVLRVVADRERNMDAIYGELTQRVDVEIALQAPVADDLRLLLSVLRVVPELERSHDLVVQIAELATHTLADSLSPRASRLVQQMGDTGSAMWVQVRDAWTRRGGAVAHAVEDRDEEIDSRHASLMAELASGSRTLPVTMDMTLVARFYDLPTLIVSASGFENHVQDITGPGRQRLHGLFTWWSPEPGPGVMAALYAAPCGWTDPGLTAVSDSPGSMA
jgi:phosphate transport system protein